MIYFSLNGVEADKITETMATYSFGETLDYQLIAITFAPWIRVVVVLLARLVGSALFSFPTFPLLNMRY
jgi:hypothetical protein